MTKKVVDIEDAKIENLTIEKLRSMPPDAAERTFNKLSFSQQIAFSLLIPWKDRQEMIMLSRNARELVQALPDEEVYWMVKERGVEDSLPVIARTSHEQFQYLMDIDCWRKDQLDAERVIAWYKLLGRCNEAKVIEWFTRADDELLVVSLKKFFRVFKIEEESDISEEYDEMPPSTIDGINYFKFESEDIQLALMPLLNVIFKYDANRYQSLIEGATWDPQAEVESDALYWRQSRAAEKGFPAFDEALSIYNFMSDSETQLLQKKAVAGQQADKHARHADLKVRYSFAADALPGFLYEVFQLVADVEVLDQLQQLMINIANKVVTADCLEAREMNDIRRSLHKAAGYVSIGLEYLSGGDPAAAVAMMREIHPELLFRCGYNRIERIATRLRKHQGTIWLDDQPRFAGFYGAPLGDTVIGVLRSRPELYEGLIRPESSMYRDFETMGEVSAAALAAEKVIAADRLLFEGFRVELTELDALLADDSVIGDTSALTFAALLATLLIQIALQQEARMRLLSADELKQFLSRLRSDADTDLAAAFKRFTDDAAGWMERAFEHIALNPAVLQSLAHDCIEPLQEELAGLASSMDQLDSRYVSAVLLRRD